MIDAKCLLAVTCIALALHAEPGSCAEFHVSPQGRDYWSGRFAIPLASGRDGPFAGFEAALDAARTTAGPDTIIVHAGSYHLTAAIAFDERDAGLVVKAAEGEFPVLFGGPPVAGWVEDGPARWVAPLHLPAHETVGDLFLDGRKQIKARHPNLATTHVQIGSWLFADRPANNAEWNGNTEFRFRSGDLPTIGNLTGLSVVIVGGFYPGMQWASDVLPVTSIDYETQTVAMLGSSYFFTTFGSRYYLSGSPELLDAPGEWWYDDIEGRLHYLPSEPNFPNLPATVGVLPTFFTLDGAEGMVISGLTFRNGSPEGSGKFHTDTRGFGAVRVERSDGVVISRNRFEHVGVGIHVSESRNVRIIGNRISHTAGNAIFVGKDYGARGRSDGARILGNTIRNVGEVYFEAAGIWFQAADGIRIAFNLIEDTAQCAILGGSIWGEQDATHNAAIEFNLIRNANQQTADGGAIKLMGVQSNPMESSIRFNFVSGTDELMNRPDGTFWPRRYENLEEWPSPISWAIYLDGRASDVTISGNVLWRNISGIGLNGGWNNRIRGNLVLAGHGSAFRVDDATGRGWRPDWARANAFTGNIVWSARPAGAFAHVHAPDAKDGYVEFAWNFFIGDQTPSGFKTWPPGMDVERNGRPANLRLHRLDAGKCLFNFPGLFLRMLACLARAAMP